MNNMNPIFKYNRKVNYSTKDLKGGNTDDNFLILDVYLNVKRPSIKIQLHIFKDDHYVGSAGSSSIGYDRWLLSKAHLNKFYNDWSL